MTAAEHNRAEALRAAEVLAMHAPKLKQRPRAFEPSFFSPFSGMVQTALHRLGMTPEERAAHEQPRYQRLQARRQRRAARLAAVQASQETWRLLALKADIMGWLGHVRWDEEGCYIFCTAVSIVLE